MNESDTPCTIVATLGHQPQVITRALDLFRDELQERTIEELVLIHTNSYRTHESWPMFDQFIAYLREHYAIEVQFAPIRDAGGTVLRDIKTPEDAELAFDTIFKCVRELKQEGRRLHGFLAGGRKSMTVYMMVASQLLFQENDRLWHLFSKHDYSPDPHVAKGESNLVEIPTFHLSTAMPMMHALIVDSRNPAKAMKLYHKRTSPSQLQQLQYFYLYELDDIDQQILLLAYNGDTYREIGVKLGYTDNRVSVRFKNIAQRFYGLGVKLPSHYRLKLLDDFRPILSGMDTSD